MGKNVKRQVEHNFRGDRHAFVSLVAVRSESVSFPKNVMGQEQERKEARKVKMTY